MNITITITRYFALGAICLAIGAALASKAPEENANPNNRTPERFGPDGASPRYFPAFSRAAPRQANSCFIHRLLPPAWPDITGAKSTHANENQRRQTTNDTRKTTPKPYRAIRETNRKRNDEDERDPMPKLQPGRRQRRNPRQSQEHTSNDKTPWLDKTRTSLYPLRLENNHSRKNFRVSC